MVTAIARSCFAALRQIRSVIGVHYHDMPYWHWSVPSWSVRLTATIAGMSEQLLSRLFQSVLNALLKRSFRRGNRITYPRCSMSSTGCGSWIGSGAGYAFLWTALPSRSRCSWHRWTVQHSATMHSQWLHQDQRGTFCLSQSQRLRHCWRFVRNWRPFPSEQVFSDLYLGRSLIFAKFLALYSAHLLHICWQRKVVRDLLSLLTYFPFNYT